MKAGRARSTPSEPGRAGPTLRELARWRLGAAAAAVALVTAVVFAPALDNDFVNWDDDLNFTLNESYRGLSLPHLRWMFTTFHMGHYHPLTWITLGLDYRLWGMRPIGYHLTNVLLHAATAAAVVYLAARLLHRGCCQGERRPSAAVVAGATAAAALFAVHPLRVESVAWATERRDCLSGLFFVLTLLAYLRFADAREAGRGGGWACALTLLCLVLSLLSKAWAVTLPVVLLVLDVYPLRRLGPGRWFAANRRTVWYEKLPLFALAAVAALLAHRAQATVGALRSGELHGPLERAAQAAYGIMFYLVKTVCPTDLHPARIFLTELNPFEPRFLWSAAAVLVLTAIAAGLRRRCPAVLAAWLAYLIILSPVLGVAQSGVQLVADRYSYLACLGLTLVAGAAVTWGWRRGHRSLVAAVSVAVIAALSILTWRQTDVWQNSDRLWAHVLRIDADNVTANLHQGDLLAGREDYEGAVARYRRALRAAPDYAEVRANLGISLAALNRFAEAEPHLQYAVRAKLHRPTPLSLPRAEGQASLRALAITQVALGRPETQATITELWQRGFVDGRFFRDLYDACVRTGRFTEAIHHLTEAVRFKLAYDVVFREAYQSWVGMGRFAEAIDLLRAGLRLYPAHVEMTTQLAWMLATCPVDQARNGAEAVKLIQPMVEAAGDHAVDAAGYKGTARLLDILAAAYAEAGDFDKAQATADQAIRRAAAENNPVLAEQIRKRLDKYRHHQPHRLGREEDSP